MSDQIILVDLENLQGFDLGKVPPHARIKIFLGQSPMKVPTPLVQRAPTPVPRRQWGCKQ